MIHTSCVVAVDLSVVGRVVCVPTTCPHEVLRYCPLVHCCSCTAAQLLLIYMLYMLIAKRCNNTNVQRVDLVLNTYSLQKPGKILGT